VAIRSDRLALGRHDDFSVVAAQPSHQVGSSTTTTSFKAYVVVVVIVIIVVVV
jgi:hypothetical protein